MPGATYCRAAAAMLWPRSAAGRPRADGMWLGKKYPYSTSTLTACGGRAFLTACDGQAFLTACAGRALPTACDGQAFLTACAGRALPTACDGPAFPTDCDGRALPARLFGVGIQSENQAADRSNPVFSPFPRNFPQFSAFFTILSLAVSASCHRGCVRWCS